MKALLILAFITATMLVSCAKTSTRITVKPAVVHLHYIRVTPCMPAAPEVVVPRDDGNGVTSACPRGDVVIVVVEPTRTFELSSEKIHVRRNSSGQPVLITADIP